MQILGQARDPAVIQAHLKKLFAGVHSVALTDNKDAITAAMSIESESVQLAAAVPVSEQVESWLQSLLTGMQATLQVQPRSALFMCTSFLSCSQSCVSCNLPGTLKLFDNVSLAIGLATLLVHSLLLFNYADMVHIDLDERPINTTKQYYAGFAD